MRLSSVTGAVARSYGYNAEGQVVSEGSKTFTWNGANRITNISGAATYGFDALGKRIKTTKASGAVEYTVYSRAGVMRYSYKPANQEFTDFVYLGSMPLIELKTVPGGAIGDPDNPTIAQVLNLVPALPPQVLDLIEFNDPTGETQPATTTLTYLHADLLSSPILWTGSTGATQNQEHYEPYGQKMNGVVDKLGYTAHVHDFESGLTYMQARFYDAQVGRFLSADPVEFDGANPFTFNRYSYANNNPYRYTDPTGMCTGSKIENDDGTCASTGGFTTDTAGAGQGVSLQRARQEKMEAVSTAIAAATTQLLGGDQDSADGGASSQQSRMEQFARNPGPAGDAARTELARMNNGGTLPAGPQAGALAEGYAIGYAGVVLGATAGLAPEIGAGLRAVAESQTGLMGAEFGYNLAVGKLNGEKLNFSARPEGVTLGAAAGYYTGFAWGAYSQFDKFTGLFGQ